MRKLTVAIGFSLLSLALLSAPEAFAGKKDKGAAADELPKIEATGIAQFDDVFMKAKTIHETLDAQDTNLKTARASINTALGVATDAPLATALADLKTKAAGKVKVAMNGTTPKLEPADGLPDNAKAGLDATNVLVDAAAAAVKAGKDLVPQVQQLVAATQAFPGQVPSLITNPLEAAKALKVVTADVKAVAGTPARIDRLVQTCEQVFTDLKTTFGA